SRTIRRSTTKSWRTWATSRSLSTRRSSTPPPSRCRPTSRSGGGRADGSGGSTADHDPRAELRLELLHLALELENAPAALLPLGQRRPALLLPLVGERSREPFGLPLPAERCDGDRQRPREREHQEDDQYLRGEPPALRVREPRGSRLGGRGRLAGPVRLLRERIATLGRARAGEEEHTRRRDDGCHQESVAHLICLAGTLTLARRLGNANQGVTVAMTVPDEASAISTRTGPSM